MSTLGSRLQNTLADRRRWSVVMAAVLVVGGLWIWASAVPASAATGGRVPSPREGFAAPDFTLEQLGGGEIALSDLRGQVVIVNFWASWCPPCRAEMPAVESVYRAYQDRGLVVLAINVTDQDSEAAAARFIEEHDLTFPVLLDREGAASARYLVRAMPTTFFVDREGVIRQVIIGGPVSKATLQTGVEALLEETP